MRTLTDLLTEYYEDTKDPTVTNKTRAIRRFNNIQRRIAAGDDYFWKDKEKEILTVANQQDYLLPVDYDKIKSVNMEVNGIGYEVTEIVSVVEFNALNYRGTAETSDYASFYHIKRTGNITKLQLWPTPTQNDLSVNIVFTRKAKDLRFEDYTTGTVSFSNNSKTVTGSGTSWATTNARSGMYIFLDGVAYEIDTVNSTTSITLVLNYEGITLSGQTYKIGDVPIIPEEFADILVIGADLDYFRKRQEASQITIYKKEFIELEDRLLEYSNKGKSTNYVFTPPKQIIPSPNFYPRSIG